MIDYHIHPDYSIDAEGTIEDYCQKADELRLKAICFTTHYDLDPTGEFGDGLVRIGGKLVSVQSGWLWRYFSEIKKMRRVYHNMRILIGIEVNYLPKFEDLIRETLSKYPFDFVLGAVHYVDNIDISSPRDDWSLFTPDELCRKYYELVEKALDSGLFNSIAHLDIYKRHSIRAFGKEILEAHRPYSLQALEKMADNNIMLEINTSLYRQGYEEPFPSRKILELARQVGIHTVTIGSDCHNPEELANDINKAIKLAKEYKFRIYGL